MLSKDLLTILNAYSMLPIIILLSKSSLEEEDISKSKPKPPLGLLNLLSLSTKLP